MRIKQTPSIKLSVVLVVGINKSRFIQVADDTTRYSFWMSQPVG